MARRKKASRSSGSSGGGAPDPTSVLLFLLFIAAVVIGFAVYNHSGSWFRTDNLLPKQNQAGSQTTTSPDGTQPAGTASKPPAVPVLPKENKLETGEHDVEDASVGTKATMQGRLEEVGPTARGRLKAAFAKAGVTYPPTTVVLVGLKKEKILEVWAGDDPERFCPVKSYRILDISGQPGPKLRQGDNQVPEGAYRISALNPNSKFGLSMVLDYPNEADRARARADGRSNLGGNVTINSGKSSTSSLPVGMVAMEELFTLASDVGLGKIRVVLAPNDLRRDGPAKPSGNVPGWTTELYQQIREEMVSMAIRGG